MASVAEEKIVELARTRGVIRPRDVESIGVHRKHLRALVDDGVLERTGRGLYRLTDGDVGEHASLAEVAARAPGAVVCLISALEYHGLTTQSSGTIWLAIEGQTWAPTGLPSRVRIVRMTKQWFTTGVDQVTVDSVPVLVTSPARTVVDCFRFRNKVGFDVAIEALRDAWNQRLVTTQELNELATAGRVYSVMRKYIEAIVT